jgi:hypothetical protein
MSDQTITRVGSIDLERLVQNAEKAADGRYERATVVKFDDESIIIQPTLSETSAVPVEWSKE